VDRQVGILVVIAIAITDFRERGMGSLRILIVDDHETVRRGVRSLLSSRPDWVVCGEAGDGLEAVEKAKSLRPDVVLMDISMPRMDGVEATRIIRREVPESKVIIVSQNDPAVVSSQAAEIGAGGYVNKDDLARDLLPAVESVVADRIGEKTRVRAATDSRKDVSERTQAERAGDLLAAIVDSSDDAIISKTLDGVITSWNKSAERILGYTREQAVGQHITLIIPEDRRDEEVKIVERLRRGERVDHFETLRVRKDGTLINLSLTISPVKDAAGCVVGASKVARDITERKQAEQALAERARLLDLSNDAILVRDEADRVTYWNHSASELYGYSREEAVGRVSHELLRTEFPEPLERITEQLHQDNRWTGELIHRHKGGRRIVVASRWTLDRDDGGNRKRVLETNNDITQQKRSEKALRESEERLRTLSDSLEVQVRARTQELEQRNAEVLQQAEQLRELSNRLLKTQDDERRRIARELHDSAGQLITVLGMNLAGIAQRVGQNPSLSETVEDTQNLVQQLSREIRTTSYLLHPPLLDESGLSQAIHWYMQGLKERSDLEIELNIPENFGRLPADLELTIFRIVQEGLTNIHRHSGSKTATISLSRNGDSVLLKIEDHGKGISPEKLTAIRAQRTGVGITGMRERVRHLKGVMDIQSNGTGATISVTFPVPTTSTSGSDGIVQSLEATG
jgi:PAS domain S-box-containing protein